MTDATQRPSPPLLPLLLVLYGLTLSAQLVSLALGRIDEGQSFGGLVVPSVLALSAVTVPSILLGICLGRQVGLGAPLLSGLLSGERGSFPQARRDTVLACAMGIALGGLLLLVRQIRGPYLPPQIPAYGHRGAIGGLAVSLGAAVAEEVWFRLGLMTTVVWGLTRLLGHETARPTVVWVTIVLTSAIFGMVHLPQLLSYGAGTAVAIVGTMLGNIAVGILYGWCYWKRSLVAAMGAHFSVDLVLHVLPAFWR